MVLQSRPASASLWGVVSLQSLPLQVFMDGALSPHELLHQTERGGHVEWRLRLAPQEPGGPHIIEVVAGEERIALRDVLFGDVFLCSGQSNMQMSVVDAMPEDIHGYSWDFPRIRILTTDPFPFSSKTSSQQHKLPLLHSWRLVTAENVFGPSCGATGWRDCYFSSVCLFFGMRYHNVSGHPVGLIASATAGTPIEYFMPRQELESCNKSEIQGHHPMNVFHPHGFGPIQGDGVLFANVISALSPMSVRAFLWYQGESNANDPEGYRCLFPGLIRGWRRVFSDDGASIPFLSVGLAADVNFAGLLPEIRQAQTFATKMENVFVVPAYDLGDVESPLGPIHPRRKKEVGLRLARVAIGVFHGSLDSAVAPEVTSITVSVWNSSAMRSLKVGTISRYYSRWVLEEQTPDSVIWLVNVSTRAHDGRMVSLDAASCWDCCRESGVFHLFGKYAGDADSAPDASQSESVFTTLAEGQGWYAAASSLPSDWETYEIRYGWEDYPQCIIYREADRLPLNPFRFRISATANKQDQEPEALADFVSKPLHVVSWSSTLSRGQSLEKISV
ncbi:hypothetical protein GUITHDRAFT_136666 [Guillardia theta CCMP2712]|uniref:Sialate O-acetylesterase domain-containing protein n=1 Tax=Guillardia theta (strain CCMP2712) TaxID=905079 RepID=L1JJQ6_GUITC|nr:hypothetical protein GUITHDRAFT_136666 [Guillardia theta CCMP2712]EKX48557.1 hypothetical protein GUITHDRAFT_136666 [Guillardia theta CCMP2712]|eukprot:XP_005835537.1 hypothetical protein GUITHDRAFT_136666 [Guillardia theta CCMP2712]